MARAFTVDALDAHDGTTPNKGHAGSAAFPALMAVPDAMTASGAQITGRQFAEWLAVAYEVSYRAGQVQHATCPDYHTPGAWTAVGVAVGVAHMLGLDREGIRHAAGIGEYHGPRSQMIRCIDHPTMLRDGVVAAPFWANLVSRWSHPSVDTARDLMREHGLHHEQVGGVEIRTFHMATRLAGHEPASLDAFAYGIAYPVATMIVRGRIGPADLTPASLKDPAIPRISRNIQLIDDAELTARSVAQRWAAVTLITTDGRRLAAPPRTPRGDTDQPLSDAKISKNSTSLPTPSLVWRVHRGERR